MHASPTVAAPAHGITEKLTGWAGQIFPGLGGGSLAQVHADSRGIVRRHV